MNEIPRTLGYIAAAGLLVFLAVMSTPGEVILDPLEEAGAEFFPNFEDPQVNRSISTTYRPSGRSSSARNMPVFESSFTSRSIVPSTNRRLVPASPMWSQGLSSDSVPT